MQYITEKLHSDHQKVEKLFQQLKDSSDGAEKTREGLWHKLKHELLAHTQFENEVFYPAVRQADGGEQLVDEAMHDHEMVEQLMEEMDQIDASTEEFTDQLDELERSVKEHVELEEKEIFPRAKAKIGEEDGQEMSRRHDEMIQEHMQAAR